MPDQLFGSGIVHGPIFFEGFLAEINILPNGQIRHQAEILVDHGHTDSLRLARRVEIDTLTLVEDLAFGRRDIPGQDSRKR